MATRVERLDGVLTQLLAVPQIGGARLSPDGSRIAWLWSGLGPTRQLWSGSALGDGTPEPLVVDDNWDCDSFRWSRDGQSIVYGRSRDGDERTGLSQIFLDGRAARQLTPDSPVFFLRGGQLLADNRTLIYAANIDPDTGEPCEASLVWRHDIETGDRIAIARPERAHRIAPDVSPDDLAVLYERIDRDPSGIQLWLVDLKTGEDRCIVDVGAAVKVEGSWSPDGKSVVLLAEAGTHRKVGLWRRETGQVEWLLDDFNSSIAAAYWPKRAAEIVIGAEAGAREHYALCNPQTSATRPFSTAREGEFAPLGVADDGAWIAWHSGARYPLRLVRLAADGSIAADLSRHTSAKIPAPADLVAAEDFRWESVDGLEIQGWLYRARVAPGQHALGTVLHIHGGPTMHYRDEFMVQTQYYAQAGFNVLQPNYRGSTGFTLGYQEAIKAEGWGGLEQEDIRKGALALIEAGIAERGRIGITGTSYGGYSAWWQITHAPVDVIAASAPICGMTDLVIDYETTRPDLRPYSEEMMGGSPATRPDRYRDRSPIHFVGDIRGKLLIVQGANDPNVTPENVTAVRLALGKAGIVYELLVFEDEGHGVSKPENRHILYRRIADFFAAAFL